MQNFGSQKSTPNFRMNQWLIKLGHCDWLIILSIYAHIGLSRGDICSPWNKVKSLHIVNICYYNRIALLVHLVTICILPWALVDIQVSNYENKILVRSKYDSSRYHNNVFISSKKQPIISVNEDQLPTTFWWKYSASNFPSFWLISWNFWLSAGRLNVLKCGWKDSS